MTPDRDKPLYGLYPPPRRAIIMACPVTASKVLISTLRTRRVFVDICTRPLPPEFRLIPFAATLSRFLLYSPSPQVLTNNGKYNSLLSLNILIYKYIVVNDNNPITCGKFCNWVKESKDTVGHFARDVRTGQLLYTSAHVTPYIPSYNTAYGMYLSKITRLMLLTTYLIKYSLPISVHAFNQGRPTTGIFYGCR